MDAITVKVCLNYDAPISSAQVTELQDKFFNLIESEINFGALELDAECVDFEVEIERNDE